MTVFRDERGKASFFRAFLCAWSAFAMTVIVWLHASDNLGVILTFCSAVIVPAALITGGKGAMQYLGTQVAGVVQGVGNAAAAAIRRRREQGREYDAEAT